MAFGGNVANATPTAPAPIVAEGGATITITMVRPYTDVVYVTVNTDDPTWAGDLLGGVAKLAKIGYVIAEVSVDQP